VPKEKIWEDQQWATLQDWKTIMKPHYQEAERMLGVNQNKYIGKADKMLKEAAEEQGFGDTFYTTPVGIYFGKPGETVPDPYFNGEGPDRTACIYCGGCMVGCRHGAKNTLDKNYLYLAEKNGAQVFAETKVTDVKPINDLPDGRDGYLIYTHSSTRFFKKRKIFKTKGVIFSGGVIGTVDLLLRSKQRGSLPRLSDRLGDIVRTNAESIIGVRFEGKDVDMSEGIAIGSGIHIDDHTHIEAVRYSKGSDVLSLTATLLTNGKPGINRVFAWLWTVIRMFFLASFLHFLLK